MVDNTWLSAAVFNPFKHGADFVVNSLTKYYSGGHIISGMILSKDTQWEQGIWIWQKNNGLHVTPHTFQVLAANLGGLESRVKFTSDLTVKVLKQLSHPKIVQIHHPSVSTHPTSEAYRGACTLYPSVFVLEVRATKQNALEAMRNFQGIEHKASFANFNSLFSL